MTVTREEFNRACPFGSKTTKKYLEQASAINIQETNQANRVIRKILSDLKARVTQSDRSENLSSRFQVTAEQSQDRHPLDSLVDIEQAYNRLVDTNPFSEGETKRYFSDIFPIPETRCATHKLELIKNTDSQLLSAILYLHDQFFISTGSHTKAAKLTMAVLSGQSRDIKDENLPPELVALLSPESVPPIISGAEFEALKLYHDIQESFETKDEIAKANKILTDDPRLMGLILDMQEEICQFLQELLEEHPDAINYSYAYGEFARIQPGDVPKPWQNSRFLKVVMHNLGPFLREGEPSTERALKTAMIEARQAHIFTQNIFVCEEREEGDFMLKGVVTKSCPAQNTLGAFFEYFLQDQPTDEHGCDPAAEPNDGHCNGDNHKIKGYE